MTTATLTGPQLEVIALLAAGRDVNEIAAITSGTQAAVNGHIRNACLALGANDRIHLMAEAYRAQLLHIPAVGQLRAELARTQAALATARREAREARHATTDARNDKTAADQRATAHEAAAAELAQLRQQLIELNAAHQHVRDELAAEKQRCNGLRGNLARISDERDRAVEEAEEARRNSGERVALRPLAPGSDPQSAAAIAWCLDKLGALARQARDGAAYGKGTPQLVDRANTLTAAASAIDQAWQRRQLHQSGARRA